MKISNFFTALRLVLAPLFFILYFLPNVLPAINYAAVICILIPLFLFMEFTDFLDGYFARKKNEVSSFGKLFDPFADVFANLTILFCFTLDGYLFPLFFLIILYREITILFIRMLALRQGITIAAAFAGKVKTVMYIVGEGVSLFLKLAQTFTLFSKYTYTILFIFNTVIYIIAVFLSIFSFIKYLLNFKKNTGITKAP